MYRPTLVTGPSETPVSLELVKQHLRSEPEDGEYNALVLGYLEAAVSYLDGHAGILGRCLVSQTWKQEFDSFARCLRLPMLALSVVSTVYTNSAGQLLTVNQSNYALQHDARGSYVRFKDDFDAPGDLYQVKAVAVTFECGFGAATAVPAAIRNAILLMVGHWYANREEVVTGTSATQLPMAAQALLAPWRRVGV